MKCLDISTAVVTRLSVESNPTTALNLFNYPR